MMGYCGHVDPKLWGKRMHQGVNLILGQSHVCQWWPTNVATWSGLKRSSGSFEPIRPKSAIPRLQVSLFLKTAQDILTPFHGLLRKKQGSGRAGRAHSTGPQGLSWNGGWAMVWPFFMGTMMIRHWTWGPDFLENDETWTSVLISWTSGYSKETCVPKDPKVVRDLKFSIILLIFLCAPEFEKLTLEALHIFLQVVGCWDHWRDGNPRAKLK